MRYRTGSATTCWPATRSARPAKGCDLDHTIPYDPDAPPGTRQTRADNLGPLSRRVHRAKTARLWKVEQWEQGSFTWTSPHGFRYEVTPEGTRALGRLNIANTLLDAHAS